MTKWSLPIKMAEIPSSEEIYLIWESSWRSLSVGMISDETSKITRRFPAFALAAANLKN